MSQDTLHKASQIHYAPPPVHLGRSSPRLQLHPVMQVDGPHTDGMDMDVCQMLERDRCWSCLVFNHRSWAGWKQTSEHTKKNLNILPSGYLT